MSNLTQRVVETALKPGNRPDARTVMRDGAVPGLSLTVGPRSAAWRLAYRSKAGARRNMHIGDAPAMPLAEARDAARTLKLDIGKGLDPAQARAAGIARNVEAAQVQTVSEAIERFRAERQDGWTRETRVAYSSDLRLIEGEIGSAPMAMVDRARLRKLIEDYLDAQQAAGRSGASRAQRIANLLASIWRQAADGSRTAPGWEWNIDPSVARGLPVAQRVTARSRILTHTEVCKLWHGLEMDPHGMSERVALIFKLSLLTGARVGTVASTRRSELDLDPAHVEGALDNGPTWAVPARDGTKANASQRAAGSAHVLPLSRESVELWRRAIALAGDSEFAFPGTKGRPMSRMTVSGAWDLLREMRVAPKDTVAHDLRRTMRSGLGDIDHPGSWEDEERLIMHAVGSKVARTYDRGRRLRRLRPIADAWGAQVARMVALSD